MEQKNSKRVLEGVVVSNKMQKTAVVEVERQVHHPIYGKRVKKRKKFFAHDEKGEAKEGAKVKIMECRPLSKNKHFRIIEICR